VPRLEAASALRYDTLTGDYDTYAIAGQRRRSRHHRQCQLPHEGVRAELPRRLAVPARRTLMSFHFSAATSFNTSGDAYSLSAANVDIPPEQSINLELGAKIDSADGNSHHALAPSAAPSCTSATPTRWSPTWSRCRASATRPASRWTSAGRITPRLEVSRFVHVAAGGHHRQRRGRQRRPGHAAVADARHSGTLWANYTFTPQFRAGVGLNARSSQTPLRNPLGVVVPGYVVGELMAEYTVLQDKLIIKGNLSNVTNRLYADALYTNHYIPGAGRLFQLTGSWKF
jgi:catecholate siderophore receptor